MYTLWMKAVPRTEALTTALELDNPEAGGMLPDKTTIMPLGWAGFANSIIPFTPHRKYLYHSGPVEPGKSMLKLYVLCVIPCFTNNFEQQMEILT